MDVRDIGMTAAPDSAIAHYARSEKLCIVTSDFGFGDVRQYPPGDYSGIIVLQLPHGATAPRILALVVAFFRFDDLIPRLSGHLAIVDEKKVRLRPASESD